MFRKQQAYQLIASAAVLLAGILLALFGQILDIPEMLNIGSVLCLVGVLCMLLVKAFSWLTRTHRRRH